MINDNILKKTAKIPLAIGLSIVIALFLTVVQIPEWANFIRPEWVVLTLIFWLLDRPTSIGLMIPWLIGILLDVLYNVPFGLYSLSLILIAYMLIKFHIRFHFFSLWQQMLIIFVLLILYQTPPFLFAKFIGKPLDVWLYIIPSVISILIWPYFIMIMRRYTIIFDK